jgi:hypothetical protein
LRSIEVKDKGYPARTVAKILGVGVVVVVRKEKLSRSFGAVNLEYIFASRF